MPSFKDKSIKHVALIKLLVYIIIKSVFEYLKTIYLFLGIQKCATLFNVFTNFKMEKK